MTCSWIISPRTRLKTGLGQANIYRILKLFLQPLKAVFGVDNTVICLKGIKSQVLVFVNAHIRIGSVQGNRKSAIKAVS